MRAGVPGFAAWVGIVVLGDPKPGSNVFISAASGAVGMSAGQLAKIRGCRVIGSTGSDEKVNFTEMLFFKKTFIIIMPTSTCITGAPLFPVQKMNAIIFIIASEKRK